jgi:hypothetical protein
VDIAALIWSLGNGKGKNIDTKQSEMEHRLLKELRKLARHPWMLVDVSIPHSTPEPAEPGPDEKSLSIIHFIDDSMGDMSKVMV